MNNDSGKISYKSPIYLQLREIVRNKIEDGEYLPGVVIPSENEFAEKYGINRQTVRTAIDALVHEGLLIRLQGKGVYVSGNKFEQNLDEEGGFSQNIKKKNASIRTRQISKYRRKADQYYGELFSIDQNADMFYVKNLISANSAPLSLEELYIPEYLLPNFMDSDLGVFNIREIYTFYGIEIRKVVQRIQLASLNERDYKYLGIDKKIGIIQLQNICYDSDDKVVLITDTYTRSDQCNFNVSFKRDKSSVTLELD